jgi:hypothetical protein
MMRRDQIGEMLDSTYCAKLNFRRMSTAKRSRDSCKDGLDKRLKTCRTLADLYALGNKEGDPRRNLAIDAISEATNGNPRSKARV